MQLSVRRELLGHRVNMLENGEKYFISARLLHCIDILNGQSESRDLGLKASKGICKVDSCPFPEVPHSTVGFLRVAGVGASVDESQSRVAFEAYYTDVFSGARVLLNWFNDCETMLRVAEKSRTPEASMVILC